MTTRNSLVSSKLTGLDEQNGRVQQRLESFKVELAGGEVLLVNFRPKLNRTEAEGRQFRADLRSFQTGLSDSRHRQEHLVGQLESAQLGLRRDQMRMKSSNERVSNVKAKVTEVEIELARLKRELESTWFGPAETNSDLTEILKEMPTEFHPEETHPDVTDSEKVSEEVPAETQFDSDSTVTGADDY